MIICGPPTVTRSLRFSNWKAFLKERKARYHLTRFTNQQQLTFENIIQDFTRQVATPKRINEINQSQQSITSVRKSSERSTRSEIIEFLVKYGIPYSLTPYLGDIRTKCLHCKSLNTACISFRDTSIMCTTCGHATTFDVFKVFFSFRATISCSYHSLVLLALIDVLLDKNF
uniref:Transposase n=1 Tax=Elaeophora elaphi TaxID=1147741 RepID=A0A0R3RSF3_9BILA